jgi:hypothetical protein
VGSAQTIVKYDYRLGATDANMALYSMTALLTLRSMACGRDVPARTRDRVDAPVPADGMMASGDLGVLIASRHGKLSITAADWRLPIVTLAFAAPAARADNAAAGLHAAILVGMFFCTSQASPRRRRRCEEPSATSREQGYNDPRRVGLPDSSRRGSREGTIAPSQVPGKHLLGRRPCLSDSSAAR